MIEAPYQKLPPEPPSHAGDLSEKLALAERRVRNTQYGEVTLVVQDWRVVEVRTTQRER